MRGTKIVATLGPASDPLIDTLVKTGVDVFRVNFSHGSHAEHARRIELVRAAAVAANRFVAILADLQGPKIRIGKFADTDSIELETGATFAIDASLADDAGDTNQISTTYAKLATEISPNDILVLGDGLIELAVKDVVNTRIECLVTVGGRLGASQGINKRGGGLSAPALTSKDEQDIAFACAQEVDYIAVSFPRSAADMHQARELVEQHSGTCGLVAKLERAELVRDEDELTALILASNAVMVARGDLGIEIGDAALMGVQKHIIRRARSLNRSVITATQMMESMITNPRPTRAEVMDVANAVLDGSDAVMLSGETAIGKYPVETVRSMIEVVEGAEASIQEQPSQTTSYACEMIDDAVAMAAMNIADHLTGVRAVGCLTSSGNTPKLMSRSRSTLPIYALASNHKTLAKVALFRSVHPVPFEADHLDYDRINEEAVLCLQRDGAVKKGDRVILSKGDYRNAQGGTNTLKILEVQ